MKSGAVRVVLSVILVAAGALSIIPSAASAYGPYRVHNTCEDGKCGVNERAVPCYNNTTECPIVGGLAEGAEVTVTCQTLGERVEPFHTPATEVWDKLTSNGAYVTDAYLTTPGNATGMFSLPRCPPTASQAWKRWRSRTQPKPRWPPCRGNASVLHHGRTRTSCWRCCNDRNHTINPQILSPAREACRSLARAKHRGWAK